MKPDNSEFFEYEICPSRPKPPLRKSGCDCSDAAQILFDSILAKGLR